MRRPLRTWPTLALSLLSLAPADGRIRAASILRPPNILILIGDDHAGGTLGIDGDPRGATPNLDRLARQGVRFDRAFCNAPVCTASRQSFITGRLPHAVGVTQLQTALPESAITLGDWLGGLGYATGAVGKMHFNGPSRHGFDLRIDTPDWVRWMRDHPPDGGDHRRPWRPFRDPAADWLNAANLPAGLPEASMEATYFADRAAEVFRGRRDGAPPFALVVGFNEPHSPFRFPREWAGRFRAEDFDVPPVSESDRRAQPIVFKDLTPEQVRGIRAAYYTSLDFLDHQVGRVLDALDDAGLTDDTIVVYWGDNGYMLGQHGRFEKHSLYEPAVRVPLIVRWPDRLPAGRRVVELVEMVDIFPTLMDLVDLPSPPDLHGRSLVPLLKGDADAVGRQVVFSEYSENEEAMARSGRFKLVVGTGRRRRADGYLAADPTPGPYERLYDLEADPGETTDLVDCPELAAVVAELRLALHERLVTTRREGEAVPEGLSEIEAIRWCLVPRDGEARAGGR